MLKDMRFLQEVRIGLSERELVLLQSNTDVSGSLFGLNQFQHPIFGKDSDGNKL
jgi:hypothetical protein